MPRYNQQQQCVSEWDNVSFEWKRQALPDPAITQQNLFIPQLMGYEKDLDTITTIQKCNKSQTGSYIYLVW